MSLLRQTVAPRRIEINLSEELFRGKELPPWLLGLEHVNVCWQDVDYGPATKLIATLRRHEGEDARIVVVDDDMYYARDLIADLAAADRASDGRSVFCVNGFVLPRDLAAESIRSDRALRSGTRRVAVVMGCGGYLLRSGHLRWSALVDTEGAPRRALFDDDTWVSGHLSRAGIDKIQITTGKRRSLVSSYEGTVISGDRRQLQTDVMRHFKDDWRACEYEAEDARVASSRA